MALLNDGVSGNLMIFSFGIFAEIYFERVLTSTGRTIFSMTSQLCGAIIDFPAQQGRERPLQRLLHRRHVGLALPAAVGGSVVPKFEKITHCDR